MRLVANYLNRMCSTFFNIAGCVFCLGRCRLSHQNLNAKRGQSALRSKFHGPSVSCEVFRACVFHLYINETGSIEIGHRIRWGNKVRSASIFSAQSRFSSLSGSVSK